jgi:sugar lactone lactonase YvrE
VDSSDATGGAPRTWQLPEHIGSLALRKGGGAVVALGDGFCTLNFTGTSTKLVDPDPGKPRIRLNDDKVDRQGQFVVGDMDYGERESLCSVFRHGISLPSRRSTAASSARNGPCWSLDGRTFYFGRTWTSPR